MDWPSLSPDLNPIENLWGILARGVYGNAKQYESLEELESAIRREWEAINIDTMADLTNSMKDRIYNVILSNGNHSGY